MSDVIRGVGHRAGRGLKRAITTTRERRDAVQSKMRKVFTGDEKRRVRDHLRSKRDALLADLRKPVAAKAIDKFSFTIGVGTLILSEFVLIKYPWAMPEFYTALIVPLIAVRYYLYHKLKYHYFMLDFCYFVQALALVHIWILPESAVLARVLFAFSNGPLIWAVAAWRNSLVFHSLDKTTSLYIHVFPCLLSYAARWEPGLGIVSGCDETAGNCGLSVYDALTTTVTYYMAWQIGYVLKTDLYDGQKLRRDVDIQTSVRWFTRSKSGMLYHGSLKLMQKLGVMKSDEAFDGETWKTKAVFMAVQFVYTLVTLLPTLLFFNSFPIHVCFLMLMLAISIWNGAVYYIEVFSKTYLKRLEALVAQESRSRTSSVSDDDPPFDSDYPPKYVGPNANAIAEAVADAVADATAEDMAGSDSGAEHGEADDGSEADDGADAAQ